MKDKIIEILKTIEDPEIFLDIWFLGLIYGIYLDEEKGLVKIEMTFTTPLCPYGPELVNQVDKGIRGIEGVTDVQVDVVFTPPWEPNDEVKALMGFK